MPNHSLNYPASAMLKSAAELATINGSVEGRYNLGCGETRAGNIDRAKKHFILAAKAFIGKR